MLDLDGTLVELPVDWEGVRTGLSQIALRHGIEPVRGGVLELLRAAAAFGRDGPRVQMQELIAEAELRAVASCRWNQALLDWIARLPATVPIAILSLNRRRTVQAAVHRIGLLPRVTVCVAYEDVIRHKPDPEGLLLILEQIGTAPEDTVLIGDKLSDLECADRAGVHGIHVSSIGTRWEGP